MHFVYKLQFEAWVVLTQLVNYATFQCAASVKSHAQISRLHSQLVLLLRPVSDGCVESKWNLIESDFNFALNYGFSQG